MLTIQQQRQINGLRSSVDELCGSINEVAGMFSQRAEQVAGMQSEIRELQVKDHRHHIFLDNRMKDMLCR